MSARKSLANKSDDASRPTHNLTVPELFRLIFCCGEISNASLLASSHQPCVTVQRSHRLLESDSKLTASQVWVHSEHNNHYHCIGFPTVQDPNIVHQAISPSGTYLFSVIQSNSANPASASKSKQNANPPTYLLHILDRLSGAILFTQTTDNVHGRVLLGGTMGGLNWNEAENAICYIAEPLQTRKLSHLESTDDMSDVYTQGHQHEYVESYGELLSDITSPRVYVMTLNRVSRKSSLFQVPGVPLNMSVGQCVFVRNSQDSEGEDENAESNHSNHSDEETKRESLPLDPAASASTLHPSESSGDDVFDADDSICVTGWRNDVRRLGITHYNTRESSLYLLPFTISSAIQLRNKRHAQIEFANNAEKRKAKSEWRSQDQINKMIDLTPQDHSAMCARFSPDGASLMYTTTDATWSHFSTQRLRIIDWQKAQAQLQLRSASKPLDLPSITRTVIDVVHQPSDNSAFPGLYTPAGLLPRCPWLRNCRHVLLETSWRARDVVILIDTATGALQPLSMPQDHHSSVSLVEVRLESCLVLASSPTRSPKLYHGELQFDSDPQHTPRAKSKTVSILPSQSQGASRDSSKEVKSGTSRGQTEFSQEQIAESTSLSHFIEWTLVTQSQPAADPRIAKLIEDAQWRIIRSTPKDIAAHAARAPASASSVPSSASPGKTPNDDAPCFESILLHPTMSNSQFDKIPLCIVPHGGPHSNFTTCYYQSSALLLCAGFAVLYINYRGSTGYGQSALDSLPGKCGAQDVQDCIQALDDTLRECSFIDPQRISVHGGSHGGYLALSLIGQHPTRFRAACVRNPVANMPALSTSSDIVDWCFHEAGIPYSNTNCTTAAQVVALHEASPIAHVSKVQTPLLMLLGSSDLRVPMAQAIDYARKLHALGKKSRLHVYESGQHSLNDKVSMEADVWINMCLWLLERFGDPPRHDIELPVAIQ